MKAWDLLREQFIPDGKGRYKTVDAMKVAKQFEEEVERLREENEKLREDLITSSKKYYDIGYACAKDMANDKVELLSAENKRLERENRKNRVALLRIQCIAQDITRPIPFQEEDDENIE